MLLHLQEHVTRRHNLAVGDARNGLLILEEAHMVLQIAQPTRIDSLMELIKNKKDKDEDDPAKDSEGKEAEHSQSKDIGEGSKWDPVGWFHFSFSIQG